MALEYKVGSTDKSISVFIQDSSVTTGAGLTGLVYNSAGLSAYYVINNGTPTAITLATLASATAAHSDGGFIARDGTNQPGLYRLDLPDAVLATVGEVVVFLKGATNMVPTPKEFQVVANTAADVVALLPAALVSGRLDVSVGAMAANVVTAAAIADGAIDRATFADDTGLQTIRSATAQAGAAGSITLDASASATTDYYRGARIYITGGTGAGQHRLCSAYNGTTKVATITPNWATNPDSTSTFAVLPAGASNITTITGTAVSTTTAQLGVNVVQISADATAADRLEQAYDDTAGSVPWHGIVDQGTAQAVTASTIRLRSAATFADDELNGLMVYIQSATTGTGQVRRIIDYSSATDEATIEPNWTTTPTGTILYKVFANVDGAASYQRSAVGLASANLDTQLAGLATSASISALNNLSAAQVNAEVDAALADVGLTTTITGRIDAAISTRLASSSYTAPDNASITAIKTKTDSLTFTVPGQVDANTESINGTEVLGNGSAGNLWRG